MGTSSSRLDVEPSAQPFGASPSRSNITGASLPQQTPEKAKTPSISKAPTFTTPVKPANAREASIIKLQAYIRRWRVESLYEKALRRRAVAEELFQTEINYVANLRILSDVFAAPLQESCNAALRSSKSGSEKVVQPIITAAQVKTLFSSAQVLLQFQELFLANLKSKIDSWHYNQTIGEILSTMTPFMRLYAEYVGNFSEATDLYRSLISTAPNQRFKAFLECAYQNPDVFKIGDLDSFMVQPVQRLPRYKLFLEQLLKLTPSDHIDRPAIQIALQKVSDVVYYVNEKKRSHDLELAVFIVFGKIEPPIEDLVSPGRALLMESPLQFAKSTKEARTRSYFFLFSDLLVVAKAPITDAKQQNSGKYKFLAKFDLRTLNLGALRTHTGKGITDHTPQNSSGSSSSSDKLGDKTASQSDLKSYHPARELCFYVETKLNGQPCILAWKEEKEALKFVAEVGKAKEKLLLARETIPTTSEGKAHAFKSTIRNHYTTASCNVIVSSSSSSTSSGDGYGSRNQSPDHRTFKSETSAPRYSSPTKPASTSTVTNNAPTEGRSSVNNSPKKTTIASSSSSSSNSAGQGSDSASQDTSTAGKASTSNPETPTKGLRRFAERKRELGMSSK